MQGIGRIVAGICSILILIFAIIHLGVSIGILARFHPYGDIFGPERGLAGFNIVISLLGLLIGGVGLFAVLSNRATLSSIVAFACIVLAFFALVSLITALIINSLAIGYASFRFSNQMNHYKDNRDSKTIVDKIQVDYNCCGGNTWLEWSPIALNATEGTTNSTQGTPEPVETTPLSTVTNGDTTDAGTGGDISSTTEGDGGVGGSTTTAGEGGIIATNTTEGDVDHANTTAGDVVDTTTPEGDVVAANTTAGVVVDTTSPEGDVVDTTSPEGDVVDTTSPEGEVVDANTTAGSFVNTTTTAESIVNTNITFSGDAVDTTGAAGGNGEDTSTPAGSDTGTTGGSELRDGGKKRSLRSFNDNIEIVNGRLLSSDENSNGIDFNSNLSPLQKMIRRKRQAQETYGGMYNLPTSYEVTLPKSCCTNDPSAADNLEDLYCIYQPNITTNLHADACSPKLSKLSVGQTLGLAVINSFMIVLALAAIPLFFAVASEGAAPEAGYNTQLMAPHNQPQYVVGGYDAGATIPYNTYNPTYQAQL